MARMAFKGSVTGNQYSGWPVNGSITDYHGRIRPDLSNGKGHTGNDLGAAEGTPVLAPAPGVVHDAFTMEEPSGWRAGYADVFGNCVILKHLSDDGEFIGFSLYAHLAASPQVKKGDQVTGGDVLGVIGSTGQSTGPHLHWGCTTNPQNGYLGRAGGTNDSFKFLVANSSPGNKSEKEIAIDERQASANDALDNAQSQLNDIIDDLQGKIDDMEN